MVDAEGYRYNVGIIITNGKGQLLYARRYGMPDAWQFPQGGIDDDESPQQAMYRELKEELGLNPEQVKIIAETKMWVAYKLPKKFRRYHSQPLCIGQKQKWFLLELKASDEAVCLDWSSEQEFDAWKWVDYWYPVDHVIAFKQDVYRKVLEEFYPYVENS